MVVFKELASSTSTKLLILDDKASKMEDGTSLEVYPPAIGHFAPSWSFFKDAHHLTSWSSMQDVNNHKNATTATSRVTFLLSSLHTTAPSSNELPLLRRRIDNGEISWESSSSFLGGASYTEGYWEWTEDVLSSCEQELNPSKLYDAVFASLFTYDCPADLMRTFCEYWNASTNTLWTAAGEESISLWDLKNLGGLSTCGSFFDEVIPSAEELNGVGRDGKRHLPVSCKYLFTAFHQNCKKVGDHPQMTIKDWVRFWFRGPSRYKASLQPRNGEQTNQQNEIFSPSGVINKSMPRVKGWTKPFIDLHIKTEARQEVYLATFLSCWLCKFVLPGKKVDLIRPLLASSIPSS